MNTSNENKMNETPESDTTTVVSPYLIAKPLTCEPPADRITDETPTNEANSDKKVSAKSKKATSRKGGAKVKTPWPKKKKIAIIAIVIALILVIAGGTVLAVVLLTPEEAEQKDTLTFSRYEYALAYDDTVGIYIDGSWRGNWSLSEFDLVFDDTTLASYISLTDDNCLKFTQEVDVWESFSFSYYYQDVEVAEFNVEAVEVAGYIMTFNDLDNIPDNATGTYVVTADLVAISGVNIDSFNGQLFGNNHSITGYDISSNGGLFDHIEDAYISGINLVDVSGEFSASYSDSIGALVNTVDDSIVVYCSVSGEISVKISVDAEDVAYTTLNVGGLIGYLNDDARKTEYDSNIDYVKYCTLDLDISVSGNSIMYVGGVAGNVLNASVQNSTHSGSIDVEATNAINVYVGGIAGKLEKVMSTGNKFTSYDSALNLKSYSDIDVTMNGYNSENTAYVGGIFGEVINCNLVGITRSGDITVTSESNNIYVANIVARAINSGSGSVTIAMNFSTISYEGEVIATSTNGTITKGEIAAEADGVGGVS